MSSVISIQNQYNFADLLSDIACALYKKYKKIKKFLVSSIEDQETEYAIKLSFNPTQTAITALYCLTKELEESFKDLIQTNINVEILFKLLELIIPGITKEDSISKI